MRPVVDSDDLHAASLKPPLLRSSLSTLPLWVCISHVSRACMPRTYIKSTWYHKTLHHTLNQVKCVVLMMQGACDTAPSEDMIASLNLTQALKVRPGQCVLVTHTAVLTGDTIDLLFENFAVAVLPNNSQNEIPHPILMFSSSDVYLSNITIHGSEVEQCDNLRCVLYTVDSSVAAEGVS